jgi:hypothetical protein
MQTCFVVNASLVALFTAPMASKDTPVKQLKLEHVAKILRTVPKLPPRDGYVQANTTT